MDISGFVVFFVFLFWCVIVLSVLVCGIIMVVAALRGKRGASEMSARTEAGEPRLVRITERKIIGGVCAGFAYKFAMPQWIVRTCKNLFE